MRDLPAQEELPLWPRPRWPTLFYVGDVFSIYFAIALLAGLLFFVAVVVTARPLWAAIFIAGVIAGVLGFRFSRRILRRLNRFMGAFPRHA